MRVLVIDDDDLFRHYLTTVLEDDGHTVTGVASATEALALAELRSADLVVLDIEMPDMSGFELLSRLRTHATPPVIIVSGREAETERVLGLDLGADDYVVKPIMPREFAARVRAVLRRAQPDAVGRAFTFGPLEVDMLSREVRIDGNLVSLTPKEFDLLAYFATRPGEVASRQELLNAVWRSSGQWQDPATVTEHIRRLRQKIEPDPKHPRWLRSVRSVGYSFDPA